MRSGRPSSDCPAPPAGRDGGREGGGRPVPPDCATRAGNEVPKVVSAFLPSSFHPEARAGGRAAPGSGRASFTWAPAGKRREVSGGGGKDRGPEGSGAGMRRGRRSATASSWPRGTAGRCFALLRPTRVSQPCPGVSTVPPLFRRASCPVASFASCQRPAARQRRPGGLCGAGQALSGFRAAGKGRPLRVPSAGAPQSGGAGGGCVWGVCVSASAAGPGCPGGGSSVGRPGLPRRGSSPEGAVRVARCLGSRGALSLAPAAAGFGPLCRVLFLRGAGRGACVAARRPGALKCEVWRLLHREQIARKGGARKRC